VITRALLSIGAFLTAVVLIALAVANRHAVRLVLDPFTPEAPVISLELPFYAYLLAMMIAGVLLGGAATWISQGKWRRLVRVRTHEALRWKGEAERLMRERDAHVAERKKQLALAGR
jgi:uncharacterized integral membrane protein